MRGTRHTATVEMVQVRATKAGFLKTCPGNTVISGNKAGCIGGQGGRLVGEKRDNQKQKRELKETVGIKPLTC